MFFKLIGIFIFYENSNWNWDWSVYSNVWIFIHVSLISHELVSNLSQKKWWNLEIVIQSDLTKPILKD